MTSPSAVTDRLQLWNSRPGWGIAADLTPPELVNARQLAVLRKLIGVGLVVLLLACAGGYYLAARASSAAADDLASAQDQTVQLQRVGRSYSDVVAMQGAISLVQSQVAQVMTSDVDLVGLLAVLEGDLPKSMVITQESVTISTAGVVGATSVAAGSGLDSSGLPRIGTVTMSGTGHALTDLSDYVDKLNTISGVVDVLPISNTQIDGKSSTQFSLTIGLTSTLLSHRFDVSSK